MNAAQGLFLKQGIGPTTIEQITSAAGVAKGTFYLHFSSKEDVRLALGDRFAHQHLSYIKATLEQVGEDDWRGRLAIWASACATGYLREIHLHDVLFYASQPPTREGLVDNIVIDHLAELLRAGADAGAWSIDDACFTAVFMFSGLHSIVDHVYVKERKINKNRLIRRLEQLCFRAVGLPAG